MIAWLLLLILVIAQHGGAQNHEKIMRDHNAQEMHGMYGRYAMTRESSGTSWIPQSTPYDGFYIMPHAWMFMFQGYSNLVFDDQQGPLGGRKVFDGNMFMIMGQRDSNWGTFAFRTMLSFEPMTIGRCGYPLLFQTGETCNGITPLVNKQHPHDLFAELALVYSYSFYDGASLFAYVGLPGEPALGPPTYMYRFSGYFNPEAPLGHHWLDSTHITFGVATAGFIYRSIKLEYSVFTGREPDQYRFNFERPRFDSQSVRFSYNPNDDWALQCSYGRLKSPEQLEPKLDVQRFTVSAMYNKYWGDNNWQTTVAIGINKNDPGKTLPALLLESALELRKKHALFGRLESVKKDELFIEPCPLAGKAFLINNATVGYTYEIVPHDHIILGFGGLVNYAFVLDTVKKQYKKTSGYMIFLQARII